MIFHNLDSYPLDEESYLQVRRLGPFRATTADSERFWQPLAKPDLILSSHLDTILEDYLLAFNGDQMNPALISSRVDTILLSIVAAAKDKHPTKSDGWGPQRRVDLSIGETVTKRHLEQHYFRCLADGLLWYGKTEDLEANLIVRKTTEPPEEDSVTVPGALLLLLESRKVLDRSKGFGMYGIVTDSYKWHFLWVGRNYQYFQATFDWMKKDERQRIINHVRDIVDRAVSLVNTDLPDPSATECSLSELMSCLVWDEFEMDKVTPSDDDY
ncbi:uncharacterized protein LDX57_000355 [Aspergillus melleus]|uniref:uncharacterized protein n=1 Tax=Aspergillus melleus TaxID=138277 RepID=UPI001E8E5E2D|nr:uncharacterized protein LDX57_000355 [Aspergillus melleus]KAH8422601.1 hypothetical protein LDX57_000355 [Aspergillus melleus]